MESMCIYCNNHQILLVSITNELLILNNGYTVTNICALLLDQYTP